MFRGIGIISDGRSGNGEGLLVNRDSEVVVNVEEEMGIGSSIVEHLFGDRSVAADGRMSRSEKLGQLVRLT